MNIDDALREYVSQPVPSGMEGRVMRRVRADSARRRWVWMFPGLVAAGLVLAVWVRPVPRAEHVASPKSASENAYSTVSEPVPARKAVRRRVRKNGVQTFWRLAQDHPEIAAAYEPAPIVPLSIEPITIGELEIQ